MLSMLIKIMRQSTEYTANLTLKQSITMSYDSLYSVNCFKQISRVFNWSLCFLRIANIYDGLGNHKIIKF